MSNEARIWPARWWLKPGESAWTGTVAGVLWILDYCRDDGTTWFFNLHSHKEGRSYGIRYDYATQTVIADGADRFVLDVLGALNAPVTWRVGPKIQPGGLHGRILDEVADHLSRDEWMDGKLLRQKLRPESRETVMAAVEILIPKYVRRHPPSQWGEQADYFSLTLGGALASTRSRDVSEIIEGVVRTIGSKFDENPSFSQYTLEEVRLALGIANKVDMLALSVIRIAGLNHGGGGSGSEFTFGAPRDSEYLADHRNTSSFLAYLRQGTCDRPSPSAPLVLPEDVDRASPADSTATRNPQSGLADLADSQYMRLAIEQARMCVSEPGRVDPMVGVVLVRDGKVIGMAHRGRDSAGEHAEFTALRDLESETVAGAVVYATLEPCTTRNAPKRPCATRLVERKVKRVFIGMLDPDVRIKGRGVEELRDAGIDVQFFSPDTMAEVEELNRTFVRDRRGRSGLGSRVGDVERVGIVDIAARVLEDRLPGRPPLRLTVKYPEIVGGLPEVSMEEINGAFRGIAFDFLHEHRKHAGSSGDDSPVSPRAEDVIEQGFRVTLARSDLVSLQFFEVWEPFLYRPTVRTTTRTYSLPKVHRLGLADLGWRDRKWRDWLAAFCRRLLKEENMRAEGGGTDDDMIDEGTAPRRVPEWPFCLTERGLLITFDNETTGPVAWGPHEVLIPYIDLGVVLKREGPLGELLPAA